MILNKVQGTGNWGAQAEIINNNNTKVAVEMEKLKQVTTKFAGYFNTSAELIAATPNATIGAMAYVG